MCYNVIICDDNEYDLNKIIDLTKKYFSSKENADCEIHAFSDYDEEFFKYVRSRPSLPIFLLDIEVPSMNGTDAARIIHSLDVNYPIIYVTGYHEEYAFTVLRDCDMLGYINKFENTEIDLYNKLDKILTKSDIKKYIKIRGDYITYTLEHKSINYFETGGKNKIKVIGNYKNEIYISIKKLYKQLDSHFIQTHQSCIVNFDNVKEYRIKSNLIIFEDGEYTNLIARNFFRKNKTWLYEHHASKILPI